MVDEERNEQLTWLDGTLRTHTRTRTNALSSSTAGKLSADPTNENARLDASGSPTWTGQPTRMGRCMGVMTKDRTEIAWRMVGRQNGGKQ
ncbi:hypothetical protein R1flu_018991 [Riccia fluitans]|uniref:Uncharacterized protein n=1 Tax=Riccia fluitans TaxID=41844 RepID=A0ABD1ZHD8_9MARC